MTIPAIERNFVAAIADSVRLERKLRVVVDPQPLPPSLDGPGGTPTRATLASSDPLAIPRDLMATAVRSAPASERERCAGGWVFESDAERVAKRSGCPKEAYVLLVVGEPRKDSTAVNAVALKGYVASDTHRWVRVLETTMTPAGRGALYELDYIIEPVSERWRVVRRIPLVIFD